MDPIRTHILELVTKRGPAKSACPSETARALFPEDWRVHMDKVRAVGRVLVQEGLIRVTHGDKEFGADEDWVGPVRFRVGGVR